MPPAKARLVALGVAGSPARHRLTTTFLLPGGVAVDAGALAHALDPEEHRGITDLLLTHAHLDHTLGLPFLLSGRTLRIRGLPETLRAVRESLLDGEIFPDVADSAVWEPVAPGQTFEAGPWRVEVGAMAHTTPCVGYAFHGEGTHLVICGDTRLEDEVVAWARAQEPASCVVECSFPDAEAGLARRYGHQTPADLKAWRAALGPEARLLVTHVKPASEEAVRAECAALRDPRMVLVKDGDAFDL